MSQGPCATRISRSGQEATEDEQQKRSSKDLCEHELTERLRSTKTTCSFTTSSSTRMMTHRGTSSSRSRSSSASLREDFYDDAESAISRGRTPSPCPSDSDGETYSHHFHFHVHDRKGSSPEHRPAKVDLNLLDDLFEDRIP